MKRIATMRMNMGGVVFAALAAGLASCQAIAGIEDRTTGATSDILDATTTVGDGGSDTQTDGGTSGTTCEHAALVGPPGTPDDTSENVSVVVALDHVLMPGTTGSAAPTTLGFDLDNVCTCCDGGCATASAPSCRASNAALGASVSCDFGHGVDNIGSYILTAYADDANGGFTEQNLNKSIAAGGSTLLVQMRNWNNTSDDPAVELSFFESNGAEQPDGGPATTTKLDGTDVWTYAAGSVLDTLPDGGVPTDYPKFRTTNAYVRGSTIYANAPAIDFILGDVELHLTNVEISMDLQKEGSIYKISNGVIGARWPTSDILNEFSKGLLDAECNVTPYYTVLKGGVCGKADLAASPTDDGDGRDGGMSAIASLHACNAVSLQFGFSAISAKFGDERPSSAPPNTCPLFSDDCN